ncbi:nucleotidyltransferase domain protein [Mycobacterium xenopi 4042]|uniref:Nucleotidyltransferase domain protein n=1 Tax=Mycobacterium xenopi 4042 TaxID=1299334 RepID=X8C7K3_MYCXE|nr:nucleotidyltransferase domain protein [Mycobacterium xenopi 4042]
MPAAANGAFDQINAHDAMRIGRDAKPVEDVASPHRPNGDETIPDMSDVATRIAEAVEALRCHGAAFAYLHGSRANNTARPTSDVDIAAYFGGQRPPAAFEVLLPAGVDLLVLDNAPLELAGKVALHGTLLFEKDPPPGWLGKRRRARSTSTNSANHSRPQGVCRSGAPWSMRLESFGCCAVLPTTWPFCVANPRRAGPQGRPDMAARRQVHVRHADRGLH